jgi:hypothetical protein
MTRKTDPSAELLSFIASFGFSPTRAERALATAAVDAAAQRAKPECRSVAARRSRKPHAAKARDIGRGETQD